MCVCALRRRVLPSPPQTLPPTPFWTAKSQFYADFGSGTDIRCSICEFLQPEPVIMGCLQRPKFGGFRSPPTATRRSYGVGDSFQRLGSAPWHLESMKHTSPDVRQLNWVLQCREHGQLYRHRRAYLGGGRSWSLVFHAGVAAKFACLRARSAWKTYYPGL